MSGYKSVTKIPLNKIKYVRYARSKNLSDAVFIFLGYPNLQLVNVGQLTLTMNIVQSGHGMAVIPVPDSRPHVRLWIQDIKQEKS